MPPGQKRTPDYTGKRFAINLATETPNGDIFIGGQNFTTRGANLGGSGPLRRLTNVTGGSYRYIDVMNFPKPPG